MVIETARERSTDVPLLEFNPEDYQIYAPAILSYDQGLCDQSPFDRTVDIISKAYGIDPNKIKSCLVTRLGFSEIVEKATLELFGYLDHFPYRNRDISKPPMLALAESYAFFASRLLINRQEMDPRAKRLNPINSYKSYIESAFYQLRTGAYRPNIILWPLTRKAT